MKKYLFFTICLAAAVALSTTFGCKKSSSPNDGEVTILGSPDTVFIKMGQTADIFAGNFKIRLDSVISESRCPSTAECIWAGRVDARFVFTQNGSSSDDILAIGAFVAGAPDDRTQFSGFKVQLLEMAPYPIDGSPIAQADYVAKLAVIPE